MSLTREHTINSVHIHLGLPKNRSAEIVECVLEIIKKSLEDGEDVLISGFGKFCVRDKGKRRGRNPQTGEDVMLGGAGRQTEGILVLELSIPPDK